ncbi:TetR/AcrR family transcriptional regulator [Rhizobium glycinendophyticum]|uniref:TetR/AcrR family transcriptional regulator n=1 Tax=Rhizobium glycinendophyticum TaxID=2589807 RepID=A0A504U9N3_9HYPH|nr:TetR/AcrR family transcriptional regulator [Rhizobium glycinendophyticum]TPP11219.1 TetR/AcrR family transcriptional regulator [Rhizobium glycinendophyticum]
MGARESVRTRLLTAAAELFYAQGVGATGIDTITARAGVAKMSLYNNFASKADLVQAYLQNRLDEWQQQLTEALASASTPEERVLAVFDSYVGYAGLAYEWGFRGCGLLNAAAELSVGDPARAIVAFQKRKVERLFSEALEELAPQNPERVEDAAAHLSFVLEGAMARAGLDGDDTCLKTARRIAVSLLRDLRNGPAAE